MRVLLAIAAAGVAGCSDPPPPKEPVGPTRVIRYSNAADAGQATDAGLPVLSPEEIALFHERQRERKRMRFRSPRSESVDRVGFSRTLTRAIVACDPENPLDGAVVTLRSKDRKVDAVEVELAAGAGPDTALAACVLGRMGGRGMPWEEMSVTLADREPSSP